MSYFDHEIYEHDREGYEVWKSDQDKDKDKEKEKQTDENVQYEVIVFENQSIYTTAMIPKDRLVEAFTNICVDYVNPEYIPQNMADLSYGKTFVAYTDRSGGDKPMIVLLTGITVNSELISTIKDAIRKKYIGLCQDCGVEVKKEWALCAECREK